MAGIAPAENRPAPHLPSEPRIGIAEDLNRPATHEVPAVHADIPFDHDTAGVHVFPDTLDPRRITFEHDLDIFGGDCSPFDKDPEQFGERAFLVALDTPQDRYLSGNCGG